VETIKDQERIVEREEKIGKENPLTWSLTLSPHLVFNIVILIISG